MQRSVKPRFKSWLHFGVSGQQIVKCEWSLNLHFELSVNMSVCLPVSVRVYMRVCVRACVRVSLCMHVILIFGVYMYVHIKGSAVAQW